MKNLQDATERICELKGSILALDALVTALVSVLPAPAKEAFLGHLARHAELMRTVLLHAPVSDHTIASFEHDLKRTVAMVDAPVNTTEKTMAKGQQRSNKETKKPSTKNPPPAKPISADAVHPTTTTVVPDRSKKKP
jgi:hypothetical protein